MKKLVLSLLVAGSIVATGTITAMGRRYIPKQTPSSTQPITHQTQEDKDLERALLESALESTKSPEDREFERALQESKQLIEQKNPESDEEATQRIIAELMQKELTTDTAHKKPSPNFIKPTISSTQRNQKPAPRSAVNPLAKPSSLASDVIELHGLKQQHADCGMYASIHSLAIDYLFHNNLPIDSGSLAQYSAMLKNKWLDATNSMCFLERKEHSKTGNKPINNLEIDEMQKIIRELYPNKNEYIVFLSLKNNEVKPAGLSNTSYLTLEDRMNIFKDTHTKNDVITYVCNTGGHWISIVALKKDGKLSFLYINSTSASFAQDINAQKIVAALRADLSN